MAGPRRDTVLEALEPVTDPELDRSIVELEYVEEIDVDGEAVTVTITLPTAWCSPAFAWMMTVDARDALEALPSVETATVVLEDHMHETEITRGVNERRSFEETFPDADGGVEAVRAELDRKARIARQYDAVEALLEAGLEPAQVVDLRLGDLEGIGDGEKATVYLHDRAVAVTVPAAPLVSYLEKARETGVATDADDVLFRTPEGEVVDPGGFEVVHRRGRLAKVNMSGQAGICSGLHEARRGRLEESTGD
ncbi:iron-sulfur cluster assembly protein [Natrialbaceae archaeon AArc-T1-2]|uniref:iron-sulfur cluster assembly protein n=1 Tax=Natrialbaceae archaeon AArc-T1-2 TaxID=3053904 RepID=UPI00255AB5C4|nr:iron-sulfur cluster assembly protein [Natrialbaceae archaeon AArc-T1-2]WIV66275.1 iron-sulfur cluster assembly protein [Natrialbaceae archaeon AArc-T1-2]